MLTSGVGTTPRAFGFVVDGTKLFFSSCACVALTTMRPAPWIDLCAARGCYFPWQAGLPPLHAVPVGKAKALLLDRQCNVPFFREIHKVQGKNGNIDIEWRVEYL